MTTIIIFSLFIVPAVSVAFAWWYSAAYIRNVRSRNYALQADKGPGRAAPLVDEIRSDETLSTVDEIPGGKQFEHQNDPSVSRASAFRGVVAQADVSDGERKSTEEILASIRAIIENNEISTAKKRG